MRVAAVTKKDKPIVRLSNALFKLDIDAESHKEHCLDCLLGNQGDFNVSLSFGNAELVLPLPGMVTKARKDTFVALRQE